MPRSLDINTYPQNERYLVSDAYIDSLPQTLSGFPSRSSAMGARISLYGLIGAARRSPSLTERNNSFRLGVGMPTQHPATLLWEFTLFDKNEGADVGGSVYQSAIANSLKAVFGDTAPPLPSAASPTALALPVTPIGVGGAAGAAVKIDHAANEALLRAGGILSPDEAYIPSEWEPQT